MLVFLGAYWRRETLLPSLSHDGEHGRRGVVERGILLNKQHTLGTLLPLTLQHLLVFLLYEYVLRIGTDVCQGQGDRAQ